MLQWFIRFPEFVEILIHLGKTPLNPLFHTFAELVNRTGAWHLEFIPIKQKQRNHISENLHCLRWKNTAYIFTARKRSFRRLCFYRCLSVHGGWWSGRSPGQRPLLDRDPSGQRLPWTETPPDRTPPRTETPWTETPLDRDPPYGNERVLHFLLEYILLFTFTALNYVKVMTHKLRTDVKFNPLRYHQYNYAL